MNCSSCAYFAEGNQCKLHGKLKTLDKWISCEDYIDSNQRFISGSGCGIYNYPTFSSPRSESAKKVENGCPVSRD